MDIASNKILSTVECSISDEGLVEIIDTEDGLLHNDQKWLKGKQNKDGWFMLVNSSSNKVLTATSTTTTIVSGDANITLQLLVFLPIN